MATSILYEPIANAFLAFIQANCASTFTTIQRRFITWENMLQLIQNNNAPKMPALMLYDGVGFGGGKVEYQPRGRGTPGVRIMWRTIVIYARADGAATPSGQDATTPGGTLFAPLVESVEAAFDAATDSEGAVTLGRTVSHCWISGESFWLTPDIDPSGLGMLTIPCQIMLP